MENIKGLNEMNSKLKDEKFGLIKKYPFNGRSLYLIDKFYILGYEPELIYKLLILNKENKLFLTDIAKKLKAEDSQNNNNITKPRKIKTKIALDEMPTLINEISNDYKKKVPDIDLITSMLFPNKINIYIKAKYDKFALQSRNTTQDNLILQKNKSLPIDFDKENDINSGKYGRASVSFNLKSNEKNNDNNDLKIKKKKQYNMIFSYNPQEGANSKKSINGFSYVFYKKYKENHIIDDVIFTFYIPVTFCIISEYPYYNSYYKLCKQIVKLFQLKKIEIPLEIILYNIINFSLSPINGDVVLNIEPVIFPSKKTIIESIGQISKKKKNCPTIKEEDEIDNDNENKNEENLGEFVLYTKEKPSPKKEKKEDTEDIFDKNIIDLKQVNQKYNMINNSPLIRARTLFPKGKADNKNKKSKFLQKIATGVGNDEEENNLYSSPDLTKKKRKLQMAKKIIDNNDTRYSIAIKTSPKLINLEEEININKNENEKKHDLTNYEDIKFPNLSGYPLIQYNLSKVLLHTLSSQDVLIIFFYSFLEKDIIFFSSNIEYLSFTINSYLNLNFPLNDEKYYFFNACVSYENFINDNSPFVGATFTTILGINSSYNSDYLNHLNKTKLKDHLAVDLDAGILYQVDDPNDKEKNSRNKVIFDYIKKICRKEIKDDKGIILAREIKILYEKLESYKFNRSVSVANYSSSKNLIKCKGNFIDYDEKGANGIKNINRNIQEGFYRLINYICLYFYQNLSLKSDDDKEDLNKIIINRTGINPETMNIIFHKDYNIEENNYTKEEISFLDELMETMKFESFVYGFIQSYNPIDLYKIPLTLTEEFISILSRKNFVKNQNINFFSLIDSLYKKNGIEKTYIDFNPFSSEYYKKLKNYLEREIYDENNCNCLKKKVKEKYLNALLSQKQEGNAIDNLKYDEYILDNNLLIKYIKYLKNLTKDEYYHMFHLASTLEQNRIKNISITEIENEIEKYSNNLDISTKRDICCSNIILLFILSIKSIKNYIDCQSFLSALFQNFNVFRKYYTMIMNLVYRLMNDCLNKKDYITAQNYFFCYYSCINSLRSLKLVPNENLMNIILKFDKIDLNDLLEKANNCENNKKENPKDINNNNEDEKLNEHKIELKEEKLFNNENIKEINKTKYLYVIYNFIKNSFLKEDIIIQKTNELKGKKTLVLNIYNKDNKVERTIEPKIKFNNGEFKYECLISTQDKILEDLNKQYENYISDLDENKLDNKILFESCLNIILFTRNTDFFQDNDDIIDTFKVIFNVFLEKIYIMEKKNENNNIIILNNQVNEE